MKKTKEEALETRNAILESALDTFYEKGYSRTTFDEIAKRIGFTKGAVYWHFRNKPDLVTALINDYIENQVEYINARLPVIKTIDDIILYFLHMADYILSSEKTRKCAFFMLCQMEWSETLITKVKIGVDNNKVKIFDNIKEALTLLQKNGDMSADINVEHITYIIMGIWNGVLGDFLSHRCPFDLKVMLKESLSLIFNGLVKERVQNASK